MIPKAFITEWRMHAPWSQGAWVEQDLIISRALVEMFQVDSLRARLAFRGGTALYKLHLDPPARYYGGHRSRSSQCGTDRGYP